jgi:hypothetical protein
VFEPLPQPSIKSVRSNQDEIDQREQGRRYAGSDQRVVGSEAGFGVERGWQGFLGHSGQLRQAAAALCEVDHTGKIFFTAWSVERSY